MSERFYIDVPVEGDRVVLAGDEAHHLLRVMRGKPGDCVILFDGTGREFIARIEACGRREARLVVESVEVVSREAARHVTLGVALPKGERQRWLVEKAVELGVSSLVPLAADRGVSQPTDSALVRLRRAVVEASKQCGRTRLMEIQAPVAAREYFAAHARAGNEDSLLLCADPEGNERFSRNLSDRSSVMLAIGPEGGFSDEEVQCARERGWHIVQLGPRILRVETAAVALAAFFALPD